MAERRIMLKRGWARRLDNAMLQDFSIARYIHDGWNALFNDIVEFGPLPELDDIALEAMLDLYEHGFHTIFEMWRLEENDETT